MANEFEREMTAPPIMAGRDGSARTIAADASAMAREAILKAQAQSQEPRAADATTNEFPAVQDSELVTQQSTGWPITRPNIPGAEPGESPLITVFRQARTEILHGGAYGIDVEGGLGRWNGRNRALDMTNTPDGAASFVAGRIQFRRAVDSTLETSEIAVAFGKAPSFDEEGKKPITGEPQPGAGESEECERLRRQAERSGSTTDWLDYQLRCKGIMYDPGLGGYGEMPAPAPKPVEPEPPRQPFAAPVCLCKFPCFKPDWEPRWKGAPDGYSEKGCAIPLGRTLYAEFQLHQSSLKPEDICVVRAFPSGRVKLVEGHIAEADIPQASGTQELGEKKMRCPSSRPITIIPVTQGPAKIVAAWGGLVCTLEIMVGPPEQCGCEISCAELADDGTILPKAGPNCSIVADFSDPKTYGYNHVALALDLVGPVGASTSWSLYSRDFPPLVEFTTDVSVGADSRKAMLDSKPAYDVPIEDREAECGKRVWIVVRPTLAALRALELADPSKPITAHLVAVVGKTRCPIEIEIAPHCDEKAHRAAIGAKPMPEIRIPPTVERHGQLGSDGRVSSADLDVAKLYKGLTSGFGGDAGYRIFVHVEIDLSVESDWQPPDCCCLWPTDIVVRTYVDVISENGWPTADEHAMQVSRLYEEGWMEYRAYKALETLLNQKGIRSFPLCASQSRSECDIARQELEDSLKEGLARAISAGYEGPHLRHCITFNNPSGPAFSVVNARGMLSYGLAPAGYDIFGNPDYFKGSKVFIERNRHFDWRVLDEAIPSKDRQPCCALVWIHGYNTNEHEAVAENLRAISQLYNGNAGCCQLFGYVWNGNPPDHMAFSRAIDGAMISARGLSYFLERFHSRFPNVPITLAAHSLGNRVMFEAVNLLSPGIVSNVVSFNAAVDNECLEPGKEFAAVWDRIDHMFIIANTYDNVLDDWLGLKKKWVYTGGPYTWASWDVALGVDGPEHPERLPKGKFEVVQVGNRWQFVPERDETTHSALYYPKVSGGFFRLDFPAMVAGDRTYCHAK